MNLLVKFRLRGESRHRIFRAARIKVDPHGRLTLYAPDGAVVSETIYIADVVALAIHPIATEEKVA